MILDGGLATELARRGYDVRGTLWSARAALDCADLLEAVHLDYLDAGAACLTTASYQISAEGFVEAGYDEAEAWRALSASVAIARRARESFCRRVSRWVLVAASCGPFGAILHDGSEYHGRYAVGPGALLSFHRDRLAHVAEGSPDLVAFETIPSRAEALAMAEALTAFPSLRAWCAFAFGDERHTVSGDRLEDCAAALQPFDQIVAVGVNCTPPNLISPIVAALRRASARRIVVYPNSGEVWDAGAREWRGAASDEDWRTLAREWKALGADWIGGCCRTTPDHVRQIHAALTA